MCQLVCTICLKFMCGYKLTSTELNWTELNWIELKPWLIVWKEPKRFKSRRRTSPDEWKHMERTSGDDGDYLNTHTPTYLSPELCLYWTSDISIKTAYPFFFVFFLWFIRVWISMLWINHLQWKNQQKYVKTSV